MFKLMHAAKKRVLLALILSLFIVAAWPAAAANIYIDYTCTLHEALKAANKDRQQNQCEAGSDDDTIFLTRDDKPRSGILPSITSNIVIEGNYHTLTADSADPVFTVQGSHLTIKNLKIVYEGTRSGKAFEVLNGKLTLINVRVKNCKRGVKQKNSHVTIKGDSDICGLDADEIVEGTGSTDIDLPRPPAEPGTCAKLPSATAVVTARYGLASGVECQLVDGPGIGVQSIVDAGFITAVNLWSYVEQGVEICFPHIGSITFIDTGTSPRAVSTIDSYLRGNSTCAYVARPGTVVLMPGQPTGGTPPVFGEPAVSQPTTGTGPAPAGCPIHTTGHLFLRTTPSLQGTVLDAVPRGSNLVSPTRTTFWYQVTYNGRTGWIGHKYVRANC
ncbi:MAG: SH3 domain-containing protein [Chloroflexi bacterium]|nr:SH3 domain-containing protein [Chloroflexota bacterium]